MFSSSSSTLKRHLISCGWSMPFTLLTAPHFLPARLREKFGETKLFANKQSIGMGNTTGKIIH
uniref:Uncharacterized protein n=1 Tax=Picea glauca TaxID=3330 RepID=A0A117NGK3_PICGL|nr:hypothetical protein ABT39_MTgene6378 [Picea glauca]